ncbi:MAG TPA: hypothetical protein HA262_10220 [Methanosarcina sp.]|nr:hypothetical protein [Methanosarcina sp.]
MAKGNGLALCRILYQAVDICLVLRIRKGPELVKFGGNSNDAIQAF